MKSTIKMSTKKGDELAIYIGYAGTVPFIFSACCVWVIKNAYILKISNAIIIYSYIILAFIGGVYWGLGINIENRSRSFKYYIYSVIPSIVCWFWFTLNFINLVNIIFIIFFLNLSLIIEKRLFNTNKNLDWYLLLRFKLNSIVTFSLSILLIRIITL